MGIVKVRPCRPDNVDEVKKRENVLDGDDPNEDSDTDEFAETGSEVVILGKQACNVPYDLYDLADLRSVLSLESWNMRLTEEEKFILSAYLPDMDQESFCLTMNELLKGENIFFGNPMETFFKKLKGGLFSPKVAHFRVCLEILEKRKHYHSLRSYHEKMFQSFMDMKGTWSTCQPGSFVEERILIWNKQKNCKPVFAVDLNVPLADGELIGLGDKDTDAVPTTKRTRCMHDKQIMTNLSPDVANATSLDMPISKPKGVLKIKQAKTNSPTSYVQKYPANTRGPFRAPPKGILKIRPKGTSITLPIQSELISDISGLDASKVSLIPQPTSKKDMQSYFENLHIISPELRGQHLGDSELTSHRFGVQRGYLLSPENIFVGFQERVMNPRMHYPETGNHEKHSIKILNSHATETKICSCSMLSYPCVPGCLSGTRHVTTTSEVVSTYSAAIGNENSKNDVKSSFLDLSHGRFSGSNLTNPADGCAPGFQRDCLEFPITYKRKKSHSKLATSSSSKRTAPESNAESRMLEAKDYPAIQKVKPLKLKLKILNA